MATDVDLQAQALVKLMTEAIEPSRLNSLRDRIEEGFLRATDQTDEDWIEGSLLAAAALHEAHDLIPIGFIHWLKLNGIDLFTDNERNALIHLATDLELARKVLGETKGKSYRLIWEKNRQRFTQRGRMRSTTVERLQRNRLIDGARLIAEKPAAGDAVQLPPAPAPVDAFRDSSAVEQSAVNRPAISPDSIPAHGATTVASAAARNMRHLAQARKEVAEADAKLSEKSAVNPPPPVKPPESKFNGANKPKPSAFRNHAPVVRDDSGHQKFRMLRDVIAVTHTKQRYTPKRAAEVLRTNSFSRWYGSDLPNRIEAFTEWLMEVAQELRSQNTGGPHDGQS